MSIEELKREIRSLSEEERHELSSFLGRLALEGDPGYWSRVRARAADTEAANWVGVDELQRG